MLQNNREMVRKLIPHLKNGDVEKISSFECVDSYTNGTIQSTKQTIYINNRHKESKDNTVNHLSIAGTIR